MYFLCFISVSNFSDYGHDLKWFNVHSYFPIFLQFWVAGWGWALAPVHSKLSSVGSGLRCPSLMQTIRWEILRDRAAGKTCLQTSHTTDEVAGKHTPIIFHYYSSNVIVDGKQVKLGLWDTSGQDYHTCNKVCSHLGEICTIWKCPCQVVPQMVTPSLQHYHHSRGSQTWNEESQRHNWET